MLKEIANLLTGGVVGKVVDRLIGLIPDPLERERAAREWRDTILQVMAGSDSAQAQINLEEAKSGNLFKSGWRPATGWFCLAGFAYGTVGETLLIWLCRVQGWPEPPQLDTADLIATLMGLLGLGGYRMAERLKGKA